MHTKGSGRQARLATFFWRAHSQDGGRRAGWQQRNASRRNGRCRLNSPVVQYGDVWRSSSSRWHFGRRQSSTLQAGYQLLSRALRLHHVVETRPHGSGTQQDRSATGMGGDSQPQSEGMLVPGVARSYRWWGLYTGRGR